MQDIDQNMNELLRKAAANYPLKVNESDWDAIAGRLSAPPGTPAKPPANGRRMGKYLFGLFLLLFLVAGGIFISREPREIKPAATTGKDAVQPTAFDERTVIKEPSDIITSTDSEKHTAIEKPTATKDHTAVEDPTAIKEHIAVEERTDIQKPANVEKPVNVKEPFLPTAPLAAQAKQSAANRFPTGLSQRTKPESQSAKDNQQNDNTTAGEPQQQSTTPQLSTAAEKNARPAHLPVVQNALEFKINHPANIETNTVLPVDPAPSSRNQRTRGFYAGIVGGPEGNQVKGREFSTCGFDVGLIFGYDLNDRFSLETGVLFTKKHYFCDGEFFNLEMPGMKLESLEGKITLFEIPLKLKYNIVRKRTWNVFSTAGLSSYVMSNENNNYQLVVNGVRQNMVSNYESVSKYFAAAVDLSVGYEFKPGPRLRLRLQPYMQLPLKGIGVGSIPVRSIGLHAGIIRSFR